MATIIRIWVYDGILSSGVGGPIDVFTAANALAGARLTWSVESLDGAAVRSASGQTIAVDRKISPRLRSDAILVTAPFVATMDAFLARHDQLDALSAALEKQHEGGAILATYCTGNFILAEAGLLNGRRATTHWSQAARFAARYPRVELRADEILVEQDGIVCGGAVTSFLDLAVRLVEKLAGPDVATTTAKALLIDTNRRRQTSYATLLQQHAHTDELVARAQRRMEATLDEGFQLPALAKQLAVSERTLNRRFKQAVGMAPLEYLQTLRVEVAKRLLEQGNVTFQNVCERVGYSDVSTFRTLFKRKTSLSPRDYQQRFMRSDP